MKLSVREKVLIGVLIILSVVIVPYFILVNPNIQVLAQNEGTLKSMETQKADVMQTIEKAKEDEKRIEVLRKEAEELFELMEQTKSYNVSLLLSDMLSRHNLEPVSLTISPYQAAPIPEARQKEEIAQGSQLENEKQTEDNTPAEPTDPPYNASDAQEDAFNAQEMALLRTADLFLSGKRSDVNKFLDEITNYNKSVIVKGFTISQTSDINYEIKVDFYEFAEPVIQDTNAAE